MATNTTNYGLRKPAGTDFIDEAADLGANWDKVDTEIKKRRDEIAALEARATALEKTTPIALMWRSTAWSIPSGVPTLIDINGGTGQNLTGNLTWSSLNDEFVTVQAGWFNITVWGNWAASAAGNRREIQVQINGSTVQNGIDHLWVRSDVPPSIATIVNGSFLVQCAANDSIKFYAVQNSGAAITLDQFRASIQRVGN